MIRTLLFLLVFPVVTHAQNLALGQWRDHLSFSKIFALDYGNNKVFGASEQGVIQYDLQDNSLSKITRITGLNDFSISAIKYDTQRSMLIVGYQNGNIDFVKDGSVNNMPDIKRANLVSAKTINSIYINNNVGYLACSFGIVVFDLDRYEIKDTYKFGPNGAFIKVNDIVVHNNQIYAATNLGIYHADLNNNFLSNFENWTKDTGFPQQDGEFNQIEKINDKLVANYHPGQGNADLILENNGSGWSPSPGFSPNNFSSILAFDDRIMYCGNYDIFVKDASGQNILTISKPFSVGQFFTPRSAIFFKGLYWIGENNAGLINTIDGQSYQSATPNGPLTNNVYKLFAAGNYVYIATGAVNQIFNNGYKQDGIPYYNGSEWKTQDENTDDSLKNAFDFLGVTIDPSNPEHAYVSAWGPGLIETLGGKVQAIYNKNNSAIQEAPAIPNNYRVATSVFDANGNLWVGNSFVAKNLVVKTPAGQWYNFQMGGDFGNATGTSISQLLVAQDNTKWMIRHRNGLYAYNDNGTISNPGDDVYRALNNEVDKGGLPSNEIFCMAEDLDGELWIGSDKGFAILYSPSSVFSAATINADQPVIEQDGNFEKILETEVIKSIAVDGGNRKWMATQSSGVYLLSEDGTKQLQHFTVDNSPLLSNEVFSVVINQLSGEVYFGTSLGVQSFLSDATGPANEMSTVTVYPNPVKPTYDGPIALRGMVRDANVKITDISGNLIYQAKSEGGQAIWNGKNFRGERVSTGVYLVFCTNNDGAETAVGKILFIK